MRARSTTSESVSYSRHMLDIVRTDEFDSWLQRLKDQRGKSRILRRLDRLAQGNPGDVRPIGKGLSELRLDVGPGYPGSTTYRTEKS